MAEFSRWDAFSTAKMKCFCSVPFFIKKTSPFIKYYSDLFNEECRVHDKCYEGKGTYRYMSKKHADQLFLENMKKKAVRLPNSVAVGGAWVAAHTFYDFVHKWGHLNFFIARLKTRLGI